MPILRRRKPRGWVLGFALDPNASALPASLWLQTRTGRCFVLLYCFLLFAPFRVPALLNSPVPPCAVPLPCPCSPRPSPAASDRPLPPTQRLRSISPHSPGETIPPHPAGFPHQWPRCRLIKAKPLLAVETFAYQQISPRPHQVKRFSMPAPPPPAAQRSPPARGNGRALHLGALCGTPRCPGKHQARLLTKGRLVLSWEMMLLVQTLSLL